MGAHEGYKPIAKFVWIRGFLFILNMELQFQVLTGFFVCLFFMDYILVFFLNYYY